MANQSKIRFQNVEYRSCRELLHPWTESCIAGSFFMGERTFRRGLLFFGLIYLLQLLMKRPKITRSFLKKYLKAYLQSSIFGTLYSVTFMQTHCLLRKFLGRYISLSLVFIPGFVSGASIFMEHRNRRNIVITTYTDMALEYAVRWLQLKTNKKINHGVETMVFMVLSGFLMYLLRKHHVKANSTTLLWFFIPTPLRKPGDKKQSQIQDSNHNEVTRICPHYGACWKNIIKRAVKFFVFGLGFRLLRSLFVILYKSKSQYNRIFTNKILKLALFLASYVAIYETVSCLTNRYYGRDSELHSILAGFLAGSSYLLERNFTFIINATTTILQILAMQGAYKGMIPYSSLLGGLVFAFCNGLLYHSMTTNDGITPNLFPTILRLISKGMSDDVQRTTLKLLYEESVPTLNAK